MTIMSITAHLLVPNSSLTRLHYIFPSPKGEGLYDPEGGIKSNLRSLYQVGKAPSDTCLRERLDDIDYLELRPACNVLLSALQRGKALEQYHFFW